MKVFRDIRDPGLAPACALTIGNFDGVHRGHQAMLAQLNSDARQRRVPSCVLTFEPHPREYFSTRAGRPSEAPARILVLRDKLAELQRCGVDQVMVLAFDERVASLPAQEFIDRILVDGLHARHVLVGDDFRFGAGRSGSYALLEAAGPVHGFDVARMKSYQVGGVRVSSSEIRHAIARGDMSWAVTLLGRPAGGKA